MAEERIAVRIPVELHERFKTAVAASGLYATPSDAVRDLMRRFIVERPGYPYPEEKTE